MLVIESLGHAIARGATPIAEIVGYGTAADAYHITAGPETGDGRPVPCVQRCCKRSSRRNASGM